MSAEAKRGDAVVCGVWCVVGSGGVGLKCAILVVNCQVLLSSNESKQLFSIGSRANASIRTCPYFSILHVRSHVAPITCPFSETMVQRRRAHVYSSVTVCRCKIVRARLVVERDGREHSDEPAAAAEGRIRTLGAHIAGVRVVREAHKLRAYVDLVHTGLDARAPAL